MTRWIFCISRDIVNKTAGDVTQSVSIEDLSIDVTSSSIIDEIRETRTSISAISVVKRRFSRYEI